MKTSKESSKKKAPEAVDEFNGFEFINSLKYERAVAEVGNTDNKEALLVAYDRLGGYIRYQGSKVINGAFWDRKTKSAVKDPAPKIRKVQEAVVEETIEIAEVEAPKEAKVTTPKKDSK